MVYLVILIAARRLPSEAGLWLQVLAPNVWFLAASAVYLRRRPIPFRLTRGGRTVTAHAGDVALLIFLSLFLAFSSSLRANRPPPGTAELCRQALLIVLVPAAEELYFRGLLLDHLRRASNGTTAAILVSVLFAILHVPQERHLPMAVLSVALCRVTLRSGSLLWAVVMHTIWNATVVIIRLPIGPALWAVAGGSAAVVLVGLVRGHLTTDRRNETDDGPREAEAPRP
jgi:membrane protease YdiL (CAAX protease family)